VRDRVPEDVSVFGVLLSHHTVRVEVFGDYEVDVLLREPLPDVVEFLGRNLEAVGLVVVILAQPLKQVRTVEIVAEPVLFFGRGRR